MVARLAWEYVFLMEISPAIASEQASEAIQVLMLKKAIKADEGQQLALIESAKISGPGQPFDTRLVGRLFNEKA
jgi:hypothetical protein